MRELVLTQDGSHTLFSTHHAVHYHSKFGAITESAHVFINAGLRMKAAIQNEISIFEMGFGTGLNAYMTALEAQKRNLKIKYTAVENFPVSVEEYKKLNYPRLLEGKPVSEILEKIHLCDWEAFHFVNENFQLHKKKCPVETLVFRNEFDLIFFDAFAPDIQPELWTTDMMKKMYESLKPGGILTTYCAKGSVKRTLKSVGFVIESIAGPPGKREMTRAVKS